VVDLKEMSGPARHEKAVYFCTDENFLPYTLFLAHQIATKRPDRDFDLIIVSEKPLSDHPLYDEVGIRRVVLDVDSIRNTLFVDQRITLAAYLRIFAPRVLQSEYRRMIYLDADMFYQRGDLSRLMEIDMAHHAIAAVRDLPQIRKPYRINKDIREITGEHFKYFNSGMLLIDVKAFTEQRIDHQVLELAAELGDRMLAHDQTALNLVLRGDWLEINPVWNFIFTHQTAYYSGFFDVCIYHFCGRRKPFKGTYGGFARRFTEPYRQFFTKHWPAALPGVQGGLDIDQKAYLHYGVLLFHAFNLRRYMRSEDGWTDDFETR